MNKSIDALTARTQLGSVMRKAEKNKTRFIVSRRGKPSVVILSVEDYMKNIVKQSTLLAEIQTDSVAAGLDAMTDAEIDKEIAAARKAAKKAAKK